MLCCVVAMCFLRWRSFVALIADRICRPVFSFVMLIIVVLQNRVSVLDVVFDVLVPRRRLHGLPGCAPSTCYYVCV